jgi:hypothetical protein
MGNVQFEAYAVAFTTIDTIVTSGTHARRGTLTITGSSSPGISPSGILALQSKRTLP